MNSDPLLSLRGAGTDPHCSGDPLYVHQLATWPEHTPRLFSVLHQHAAMATTIRREPLQHPAATTSPGVQGAEPLVMPVVMEMLKITTRHFDLRCFNVSLQIHSLTGEPHRTPENLTEPHRTSNPNGESEEDSRQQEQTHNKHTRSHDEASVSSDLHQSIDL